MATSGCYVLRSGLHHNDLFNSRRPVEDVVADPETNDEVRRRLAYVARVLDFAAGAGLNTAGAYGYFIQNDRSVVSYIVQAAHPDQLKSVTWWFPVVGRVPYLGFFEEKERDAKAAELSAKGFDVDLGMAGAFSSLGWFDDPIFSSMLGRQEGDLAHLFLHELVHRTVWIPGSTAFNEQLAEYVAELLTSEFLKINSMARELDRYQAKRHDRRLFHAWLQRLRSSLEELYARRGELPRPAVLARKQTIFERFQTEPVKPAFRRVDYVAAGAPWNNAAVLASSLYAPDAGRFARAHACVGRDATVAAFLAALAERTSEFKGVADPHVVLDGLCANAYSAPAKM
jgi:predicted aminopeptidase